MDLDWKPLSDTIEPEQPGDVQERGEVGREGEEEDSAHWKKKKALDSEDDEPPPPYTKIDPQEAKFDKAEPQEPPERTAVEKKLAPEGASPTASSSSAVSPYRITSPRGRTLSDLTRITPEDEARLLGSRENILESSSGSKGELAADTTQLESLSESTLVNSGSQSEASQTASSTTIKLEPVRTQPKLVLDRTSSPLARRREAKKEGRKPNGGVRSPQQELEKQAANLTVGYGQVTVIVALSVLL